MEFQTPIEICKYMTSFLPNDAGIILEPTKGEGNLVNELETKGKVIAPDDFFKLSFNDKYNWIVMNPPFSPMKKGYEILYKSMDLSNNIIALMPWLVLINGKKRTQDIFNFGLKSVTHLPREIFKGARVQCCILELRKNHKGNTILVNYN